MRRSLLPALSLLSAPASAEQDRLRDKTPLLARLEAEAAR